MNNKFLDHQECIPMYGPAVALESTATMTPLLNLKASVVVPWSKWIFTSLFSPVKRAKFWAI